MFWFNNNKRKKFIGLLKRIINDEDEFNQMIQHLATPRNKISKNKILTAVERTKEKGEIEELLLEVKQMIIEDIQLVHLLLELRRKGTIYFVQGKQGKEFREVLSIANDMLRKSKELFEFIKRLSYDLEHKNIDGYSDFALVTDLQSYIGKLRIFSESEQRDIEEIENDIRKGLQISKERLLEVKEGSLRVEVYESYNDYGFELEGNTAIKPVYPFGLVIFDYDYFVGIVALNEFKNKEMIVKETENFIRGRGYVQRAIELLLRKRIIDSWISDDTLSPDAIRMYGRLAENKDFIVEDWNGRKKVRLR